MKRHNICTGLFALIMLSSGCAPLERETQPTQSADAPSLIHTLSLADYPPSSTPYHVEGDDFWLVHTPKGKLYSFRSAPSGECGMELDVAFLDQPDTPPEDSCLDDLYFCFCDQSVNNFSGRSSPP